MSQGFILCMTRDEAAFFRSLLGGSEQWSCNVTNIAELERAMGDRPCRTRLVSFCSDLIIPRQIVAELDGHCFNFHSGPPDRPGFRPTAFAYAQRAPTFGVTFHRLTAKIDAGTIYATRRFELPPNATHHTVELFTYQHLIELAKNVAPQLADFDTIFQPSGDVWNGRRTTRADYELLRQSPRQKREDIAQ